MAFDLIIEFAGLCLFTRARGPQDKHLLQVLLPPTDELEPGHEHYAVLGFPIQYEAPGSPSLSCRAAGGYRQCDFSGLDLDLSGLKPDGSPSIELDRLGVVDLSDVTHKPARPEAALSTVVLGAGTVCDTCDPKPGVPWTLEWKENGADRKKCQHFATMVHWRVPGIEPDESGFLTLRVRDRRTEAERDIAVLRPDELNKIRMYVFHTPPEEHPTEEFVDEMLEEGQEAHHFRAFYRLFDPDVQKPIPKHVKKCEASIQPLDAKFALKPDFHGRLSTCAVAQLKV